MKDFMLYYTVIPVLLGDGAQAGRIALRLYSRYQKTCHWLGRGLHPLLMIYARRHPFTIPLSPDGDALWVRRLRDFAKEHRHDHGFICLIPCGAEAEAFLMRVAPLLEDTFIFLPAPAADADPLHWLIRSQ